MRYSNLRWSWLIVLVGFLSSLSLAQQTPDIRELALGKPLERELAGGEVHAYSIKLTAGQFLNVIVDQRGIDAVVTLFAPDGTQLMAVDNANGAQGPESVLLVAHARLRSQTAQQSVQTGGVTQSEEVTEFARRLAEARTENERAMLLAQEKELVTVELVRALNGQGKRLENQVNYEQALNCYRLARNIAERIGNQAALAVSLTNIGWASFLKGDSVQALEYLRKSLVLKEALGDKPQIAFTLSLMGGVYSAQGDYDRALELQTKGLALAEGSGNNSLIASLMLNLGMAHGGKGDSSQALEFFQKSLSLSEESGDKLAVANALDKLGNAHRRLGNYALALEYAQRSLQLSQELGNKRQIIFAVITIGEIHRVQSNYGHALEYFHRGLALSEELGNKKEFARALDRIGLVHYWQGDYARALESLQKALTLSNDLGSKSSIASTMSHMGQVYSQQGDYALALEFYQRALALREALGEKWGVADTAGSLGDVYLLQGNYSQALEYLQKSLTVSEELNLKRDAAFALYNIAIVHEKQGNYAKALEAASRSAAIARQIGSREYLWNALAVAGQSHRALNDLAKARQAFEEAIRIVESIRSNIVGDEARTSYFTKAQKLYELYVDLLMELHRQRPSEGHDAAALQASERARARSLLEILMESHADIRQGVDPVLLERERTLRQRLNAAAERQVRFLSGKHTLEQAALVRKEVAELTASLQDVEARIRLKSPRYAALTQPVPLSLKEIQQLLDQDTLLLEYALGEDRSYLWAVTQTAIKSYELPKRAEIEKSAKEVYSWLTAGYRGERFIGGQRPSPAVVGATRYTEESIRLSRMVFAPVASQLATKRLLIVSDGVLQYIPFAALPDPAAMNRKGKAEQPLLVNHEIVSLPSASVLAVLRREFATRAPAPKSVAVLADPVFEEADERVRIATASNGTTRGGAEPTASKESKVDDRAANSRFILERALSLQPSTGEDGKVRAGLNISRLPFTRREAAAILAAAPAGAGIQSLDFRASRATATNSELSQYRIVHFATHGLLNSERPELSGIILSLVDENGRPQDGFLRLHEIYNLSLNAELVVLSACQTGLGKEIKGEGLIGLTRGFMYAGSPRVVASLWKVDDVATAELMQRFYRHMLTNKRRPAAALRAAQVEMRRQPRWQSPYYWAAFQLQGEWR